MQDQMMLESSNAIRDIADISRKLAFEAHYGFIQIDEPLVKEICDKLQEIVKNFCYSCEYSYRMRDVFTTELCWGVPNYEVISEITSFFSSGRTIEIGCGLGLWSALCEIHGFHIDCSYDDLSSHQNIDKKLDYPFPQELIRTKHLTEFDFDNVLIVWPTGEINKTPENDITNRKIIPKRIVFCGEGIDVNSDGTTDETSTLTGSIEFHRILAMEYNLIKVVHNPSWHSFVHDATFFYERKDEQEILDNANLLALQQEFLYENELEENYLRDQYYIDYQVSIDFPDEKFHKRKGKITIKDPDRKQPRVKKSFKSCGHR